ncbi:TetR/AcrR family transcriptional regulator [Pseudoramibacter sp.]|jgi:AcrR family transcriptional regulator|uniref:TetR/AcrR family transcriptional regulator n=1 Tax=Pseudoramibacter sp. TaxID=2034862 RepID=UPI0025F18D21|nr:TetR/AcrR family transcriptional regulator [Pseudoramibacter sp.]MCH4071816.1 TetR/AcrR family transcriptional regulator [Pseudoramibacter sp.]MCH4105584.1 TetR/AcrR family transcriptional regulator [Pseudoramibacter sp.]
MNKKGNAQYQQTHRRIVGCVLDLLDRKPLRQITVAEICRSLGLNRSTFYDHFLDVYDVIDRTAAAYDGEILDILGRDVPRMSRERASALLAFIQKRQNFYAHYYRLGRELAIPDALIEAGLDARVKPGVPSYWRDTPAAMAYYTALMKASYNAVIRQWLARGCKETPEWVCDMMLKCADSFGDLEGTP